LSFDLPFPNRVAAGRALGHRLRDLKAQQPVVLALPNGGVVVAAEVARSLTSPLDVIGVRKLRTPGEPELALGAVAEDEVQVLNRVLVEEAGLPPEDLERLAAVARTRLDDQLERYRAVRPAVPLQGRTVVLVDDGLTTGSSAAAAARVAAARGAARVVVAVPVSSREAAASLGRQVDAVVCLMTPPLILALDEWYEDFPEVPDEDVIALLARAADS
jgi:predicted phosphoribosyltransferase